MCCEYWNLEGVSFTCPACNAQTTSSRSLQTHFMGGEQGMGCTDYYKLGDEIPGLGNMSVTLGSRVEGCPDDFIGFCNECGVGIDFAAEIKNGVVVKVWPYHFFSVAKSNRYA